MIAPDISALPHGLAALPGYWGAQISGTLLSPGSSLSVVAIACGLVIATAFTLSRRVRKRPIPLRVLVRALFPRHLLRGASGRADIAWMLFGLLFAGLLFGGAILSYRGVGAALYVALTARFGVMPPTALPHAACVAIITLALFVAYEFAYWLDHFLKHKVPALWHFHIVHHSAETLSPLTNFRVHPVDTFVFYNIVAAVMGATAGALDFAFGAPVAPLTVVNSNVLILGFALLLTNLQHSHLWIVFPGRWGRWLLSPAHHQIHHSIDPAHHDRNFGSSLALWDRLFGTFHAPAAKRERLRFGVAELECDPHGAKAALVTPFVGAARTLRRKRPGDRSELFAEGSPGLVNSL